MQSTSKKVIEVMASSCFFADHSFEHVAETGSTNDDLKNYWNAEEPVKKLILADYQTAGRGQFDRKWIAEKHSSLLFSFSFDWSAEEKNWAILAGVAFHGAILDCFPELADSLWVKWPNDIWFNLAKLSGILVEGCHGSSGNQKIVIGIGMNLRKQQLAGIQGAWLVDDWDEDLREKIICCFIRKWDDNLFLSNDEIVRKWRIAAGNFWKLDFECETAGEEKQTVQPVDINPDGSLIVIDKKGRRHTIVSASLRIYEG